MYYGIFGSREDILREFSISGFEGTVVFASYEYEDYSGSADVVFGHKGKLYHVEGSHCSCYGLEGQFDPVEMPVDALRHIVSKGSGQLSVARDQLLRLLDLFEEMDMANAPEGTFDVMLKLAYG